MSLSVLTPLPGTVVAIEDVPDAVFAQKFVGPGVAVDPIRNGQDVTVLAPVNGKLAKIHPHAFVILTEAGVGVLVHLGLDTVTLQGKGCELHAKEGSQVNLGDPIITWNPTNMETLGFNPICPVITMEVAEERLDLPKPGAAVNTGDKLLSIN